MTLNDFTNNCVSLIIIQKFDEGDMKGGALTEESSFATLFPAYREKYLRDVWPLFTRELKVNEIDLIYTDKKRVIVDKKQN